MMAALFVQPQPAQQPYQQHPHATHQVQQQQHLQQRQPSLGQNVPSGMTPAGQMSARAMPMQYVQEPVYLGAGPATGIDASGSGNPRESMAQNAGQLRRESEAGMHNTSHNSNMKPARPNIAIPGSQAEQVLPPQSSPTTAWNTYTSPDRPELLPAVSPTDHNHLFNAYIYDYLYQQGYREAARAFLVDAPKTPVKRGNAGQGNSNGADASNNPANAAGSDPGRFTQGQNGHADVTDLHTGNAESSTSRLRAASLSTEQMQSLSEGFAVEDEDDAQDGMGGNSAARSRRRHARSKTGPAPGTAGSDKSDATQSSISSSLFGGTSKDSNTTNVTSIMGMEGSGVRKRENGAESEHPRSSATPPLDAPTLYSPPSGSTNKTPRIPNTLNPNVENGTLPEPDVQITAPKGFLFEWWSVFWDIFRARGEKGGSPAAKAYYQVAQHPSLLPTRYGQPLRQNGYLTAGAPAGFEDAGVAAAQRIQAQHHNQMQMQMQQQAMRGSLPPQSAVTPGSRAVSLAAPNSQDPAATDAQVKAEHQQNEPGTSPAVPNKPSPIDAAQSASGPVRAASMSVLGQTSTAAQQQHPNHIHSTAPAYASNGQPVPHPGPAAQQHLQYRGPQQAPPQMAHPQLQHVQAMQGQVAGHPAGMVQVQGARPAMAGGPAQRRYAVSGAPPAYAGQPGQPGLVYRTAAQPGVQPGPHVRIVSGPGGQPHLQQTTVVAGQPGQHIQYVTQGGQPTQAYMQPGRPGHPIQQVVYQQQQQQQHPQMQVQPGQSMAGPPQHRPGMPPQHTQQQQQGQMHQQQHQVAGKGRPPSVAGQHGPENMSSPVAQSLRAPSRSAASPFAGHAQVGDAPAQQNGVQQFARPGQPMGPADHESPRRRPGEATPPELQQQMQQQRLMEQHRQAQAGSPHNGPQQQGQMQEVYKQPMQPRARQLQHQQQQQLQQHSQPQMNGQMAGGPEAAFSPHGNQGSPHPSQAAQQHAQHQQMASMPGFRPTSTPHLQNYQQHNGVQMTEQQQHQHQQYWAQQQQQQQQQQQAFDGPSPQHGVAPSPRPDQQLHQMQNGQAPPYAEIQEALARHPNYNGDGLAEQPGNMPPPAANGTAGRRQAVSGASGQQAGPNGMSAATPAASAGAPTPTAGQQNEHIRVSSSQQPYAGNQGSPDAGTTQSQPATPRTPSTAVSMGLGGSQEAAPTAKPAAKGRKRNATEAIGGPTAKESKKARATRSNTATSAAAAATAASAAADVAVPDSIAVERSIPTSSQQQHYDAQQAARAPNGVQQGQPPHAQAAPGNIAVPVRGVQYAMQQPGQSQDIAVNGSIDFADLSQFGIDTNITFDPSAFTMLDDTAVDFNEFLSLDWT